MDRISKTAHSIDDTMAENRSKVLFSIFSYCLLLSLQFQTLAEVVCPRSEICKLKKISVI
jgi:hypothetical protein